MNNRLKEPRIAVCRAFTLAEMIVSLAVMSILLVGVTSTVLLASHALPRQQQQPAPVLSASSVAAQIEADLTYATRVIEVTPTAITVEVADRGHGDPGPETIRYAWSGVSGSPLYRYYNGVSTIVISSVSVFSLTSEQVMRDLDAPPRVLMLASSLSIADASVTSRKTLLESWGMTVQLESIVSVWARLSDVLDDTDVIYVMNGATDVALSADTLKTLAWGIAVEEGTLFSPLGIASQASSDDSSTLRVLVTPHTVTAPFTVGSLQVATASIRMLCTEGTIASGGSGLAAQSTIVTTRYNVFAVERGATLRDSTIAVGRRITLPWGRASEIGSINPNGRKLYQRCLTWAAAEPTVKSVNVSIQSDSDATNKLDTRVRLVNQPRLARGV